MPELKCTVQTCVHNQQYLCDLDKIQVGGENAKNPQETCCDSFQERKDGTYSNSLNSMHEASDRSAIDCKATNCMYNEQCYNFKEKLLENTGQNCYRLKLPGVFMRGTTVFLAVDCYGKYAL